MADVHLTFYVTLTDPDQVRDLQAQWPNGWPHGPQPAADELGIPFKGRDVAGVSAPSVTTAWHPEESSGKFLYDRQVFRIKSGAFFGLAGLFGVNTRYIWYGYFRLQPATDPPTPSGTTGATVVEPIPQRRWIDGGEAPAEGVQFGGATGKSRILPLASRVVGGMGMGIRSSSGSTRLHTLTEFGAVVNNLRSWERLYVRLRRLPTAPTEIWRCNAGGGAGAEKLILYVSPTGQLLVFGCTNGSVETLNGISGALVVGEWNKIDLLTSYEVIATNSVISYQLWRNGALEASGAPIVRAAFSGLVHAGSTTTTGTSGSDLEIDIDDWICAEWPRRFAALPWSAITAYVTGNDVLSSGVAYTAVAGNTNSPPPSANWARLIGPHDWMAGSHVRLLHPTAFGAGHDATAWPGSVTVLDKLEGLLDSAAAQSNLASTTSGGVLQVQVEAVTLGRGAVSAVGAVYNAQATAGAGTVGIGVNGAAPTMAASHPVDSSTVQWHNAMYRPAALAAPLDFGLIRVQYTKAANANAAQVIAAAAAVEYVGVWGPEDIVPDPDAVPPITAGSFTFAPNPGIHNRPYPDSPWATSVTPPLSGVQIIGGLYTGTGANLQATLEQLLDAWPVHFWMARKVVPSGITWWWSTMIGPHGLLDGSPDPQLMARALLDPTYVQPGGEDDPEERYKVQLSGSDGDANSNAASYQFIAVCDPGSRFLINGAFSHGAHATSDASVVNALADAGFTPTFGLFWREYLQSPAVSTASFLGKGPGSAVDGASVLNTTETASAITFGTAGSFTSKASQHNGTPGWHQVAYALMRAIEPGSTDPGVVFQIASYIGDGSASRTIQLTPVSGKRPLFAMVVNAGGVSYMRDPSHTTNTSSPVGGGATIATGIMAGGIDSISVGVTLNTNAVGYSIWVIPGSATAGANAGWSINGTFDPVEPAMPFGSAWSDPFDTDALTDAEVEALGEETEEEEPASAEEPDLSAACEPSSRRLVNIALSRIGVSKQVVNINTDLTQEAELARLHFKEDAEATLRDFPWPFATRYADLVLVAGTATVPVNADWQYSYRSPSGMVFARRIVGQGRQGRSYDPNPLGFREGSDAGGSVIYANEAASTTVPLTLEYTTRMTCPASQGDPLFRTALAWRLAHSLAPALAQDTKKQAYCWAMYSAALDAAAVAAANEKQDEPDGDAPWISGR